MRSSDGVNIAYTAFGRDEGETPLVCLRPPHLSHMSLEFRLPWETRWHEFETLAEQRLVVRMDPRSAGLSDRGVEDLSLEARCQDIDAVVDRLGLERFALHGQLHAGSWAIAYAARNPGRVTRLILVQCYTNGGEYWSAPARRALEPLMALDWVTYTEASMSNAFAWTPGELPRALAAQMRASITQRDFVAFMTADRQVDVTGELARVACPVLVTHFDLGGVTGQDMALKLAATPPEGRLFMPRRFPEAVAAYGAFIDEVEQEPAVPEVMVEDEGLRIFLVANGNSAAPGAAERLVEQHGGVAVSSLAGTVTSLFDSARQALECGAALAFETGAAVGIHAGEPGPQVLDRADPALVTAVVAASRAEGGRVLVSNLVRELSAGKGFTFEPVEPGAEAGENEGVRLFALTS